MVLISSRPFCTMRLFTILLCYSYISTNAKNKGLSFIRKIRPENSISFSYSPQWYLNKGGVHNDGKEPDVISAKNTRGYALRVMYERITRYGLIINAGLQYGRQNHDVDITYRNLSFFDDVNKEQLSFAKAYSNYKGNVGYIGWNYMMGCQWLIGSTFLKGCRLQAKAGLSCRISITESYQDGTWKILYNRNDTLYLASFGNQIASFGKASTIGSFKLSYNADIYLGLKRPVNWHFMKDFSLGILVTHSGFGKDWGGIAIVHADSKNFSGKIISTDAYRSQDFSFGVKMAMGLWYK